jgi:hypothetical protein
VHLFPLPIIVFALLAGLQAPPAPVMQQTPEAILSKAVQAIGGRRALEKMKSFQLHGVMRLPDARPVIEIDLSTSSGGKVLGIMTYIGLGQSRYGSDGTTAWEQNYNASQEPIWALIDDDTLSQKVQQMNWLEWFTMLPAKLGDIEFSGSDTFDEEDCWKLSISEKEGKEQEAFFSKRTFRPKGRRTIEPTPNGDATIDVYFRDWQRVGDLLLFHTVEYNRDGSRVTLKLDRISTAPIGDSLFSLPEQIKLLVESK